MIITREEIKYLVELNVDSRIYFELKTYYHPITPQLFLDDLKLDWDFHRVFKLNLEKLADENPLVKTTSLRTGGRLDKITINTPMRLEFKIDTGNPGEHAWIVFNKDRSEQIRLRKANLTNFELLVYLTIGTFRDVSTYEAFPSQVLVAEILKTKHSSVSRAVDGLVKKGVLRKRITHHFDDEGLLRAKNYYYFDVSVLGIDWSTGEIVE